MKKTGVVTAANGERFRAGRRMWEPEDDVRLAASYPDEPNDVLAQRFGRTVPAIYGRAGVLGLHKSAAYLASPHACRLRRGDNVGAAYRFPKGHVPANKGLRRPGWSPGRMKETQFKPGMRSGKAAQHYLPIGSTRWIPGSNGIAYLYRKVSDVPNVAYTVNWMLEHRLLWTAAHGPIPAGHALVFKNGDPRDIRLDNFELIPRRTLMARNTVHNLPEPLPQTIQLLGALKRQIRRRTDHGREKQDRRSA